MAWHSIVDNIFLVIRIAKVEIDVSLFHRPKEERVASYT